MQVTVCMLILSCVVYTLREWSLAYFHTINQLLHYLHLERKDRDFLLEAIYHLVKKAKVSDEDVTEEPTPNEAINRRHRSSLMNSSLVNSIFKNRNGQMARELRDSIGNESFDAELTESELRLAR